ncbi:peptidoglycan-binding protein [Phyllobacterium myrsinacearum]|uniref:Localization factor PodJL n=1 Tax=Phyllobacterium myrsinacearum TaxID=28101 RepID=A0A839EE60_9HYPH|nr:peptidoglycan-binding protein [Phyllobacterium myrsinacearum]MBA8877212.1 localization factor PodJL [Phyllobacterium myrsinacearum]
MTNQRSLLEQVNVNRSRRDTTSLDSINRTLEALETQLRETMEPDYPDNDGQSDIADRFAALASRAGGTPVSRSRPSDDLPAFASKPQNGKHDLSAIAARIKQLREEMRDDARAPVRPHAEPHTETLQRLHQSTASRNLDNTSGRADNGHLSMLRGDLDELKRTVTTLAREESVKSLNHRWDAMDERFDAFRQDHPLGGRLDQIRQAVDVLPQSIPLKKVEDKLKTLASAVEQMSRTGSISGVNGDFMRQMDERLDEISRAIVATARPVQTNHVDTDAFERLEARIATLSSKVEAVAYDRTSDTILQRMGELAERVDHLAAIRAAPAVNLDALSEQLSAVTRHLENTPASISISDFRDLEDRVLHIIHRLETTPPQAPAAAPAFMDQIDQRFEELTRRLDDHHMMAEHSDIRLTDNLEARFDDMARYIAQNVPQADGSNDAIRSLELQIAGLAEHLSHSNDRYAEFAAIPPRLDAIEESIAMNRDFVVEAARQAASEAIRNSANFGNAHDGAIARELADDLKILESLARKSEDRNSKTFEAIHDTLLKIVDRLGSLEGGTAHGTRVPATSKAMATVDAYEAPYSAAEAVFETPVFSKLDDVSTQMTLAGDDAGAMDQAAPARKSLLGSLTRSVKSRSKQEQAHREPTIETIDTDEKDDDRASLDSELLNRPLEPGSGMPDLNSILKRVRDERREMNIAGDTGVGKADFIAAARRAAQAAAAEVENQTRGSSRSRDAAEGKKGSLLARQRKPILLAIGAIMIAIAGLQLKNAFFSGPAAVTSETSSMAAPVVPPVEQKAQIAAPVAPVPRDATPPAAAPQTSVENTQSDDQAAAPAPTQETVSSLIAAQSTDTPATDVPASAKVDTTVTPIPAIPVEAGPEPLREAAAEGNPKALFEIGDRYMDGRGVQSDYAKAAGWYTLAADKGFAPAQYRLGNFSEKGLGVPRDLAKAKTYYQLAAEQGNASAMHNLAVLFAAGANGAPDNESAAMWFTKAAELGVKDSQFNLAILSAKGMGVPQNLEESYKWFALAANAGDKDAGQKRDDVAKVMTPDQLTRAREATELWKPKVMNPETNALSTPDEWRESPTTTGSVDMGKAIRNIQLILNKNGYDAGGSDGRMGAKTRDAIMAFQKSNGLKPTGNIDKDLVKRLLEKNT